MEILVGKYGKISYNKWRINGKSPINGGQKRWEKPSINGGTQPFPYLKKWRVHGRFSIVIYPRKTWQNWCINYLLITNGLMTTVDGRNPNPQLIDGLSHDFAWVSTILLWCRISQPSTVSPSMSNSSMFWTCCMFFRVRKHFCAGDKRSFRGSWMSIPVSNWLVSGFVTQLYIYIYTYVHIYIYTYRHIYIYIYMYTSNTSYTSYTYLHIYIYTYIHIYIYTCVHIYIYTSLHIYIYTYIYIYIYTYTHIHIFTFTHIHINT